jgi:hypothetical protein
MAWYANVSQINSSKVMDLNNLVLQDTKIVTTWASFDFSTITIVQVGYLGSCKVLISRKSLIELLKAHTC